MKIAVIGTGYVGLVSGTCFAELGFDVTCVDIHEQKIENLKKGIIPIYEPGLEDLVQKNKKKLSFSTDLKDAMSGASIVMIAVGTPTDKNCPQGQADLSYVYAAAKDIAKHLQHYQVIVTKSTVPVGTGEAIKAIIQQVRPDLTLHVDYDVASNPEFLREGSAILDFMNPDRIVVGYEGLAAGSVLNALYAPLKEKGFPLFEANIKTAELIKYAANAFLATKIAFINQISDLCENVDANIMDVSKAIGLDQRIGPLFLNPGPGYGGSCFPKDTKALAALGQKHNTPLGIIDAVIEANDDRKCRLAQRLLKAINTTKSKKIAILGLTFKANTDDLRDAASLVIVPHLVQNGLEVTLYDPLYHSGQESSLVEFSGCRWAASIEDAVTDADALCILTEWAAFKTLDLKSLKSKMRPLTPLLVDYRNIYNLKDISGFHVVQLGQKDKYKGERHD